MGKHADECSALIAIVERMIVADSERKRCSIAHWIRVLLEGSEASVLATHR
jgi:hypothetical protein